ncbi:MAG: MOSC domain-containing protein [Thermodesulfobacteriota bacterium]
MSVATIVSLNISTAKGTVKTPVAQVELRLEHGLVGDAHAGAWHRQVSLLAVEEIDRVRAQGLSLAPGSFAENITVAGLDLAALPVGTRLVSGEVELEITQIGKTCHSRCAIHQLVGDCIMPRQGVFARVIRPGTLRQGDSIHLQAAPGEAP